MNKNLTIQRINVSKGLSLYKTGRSPYDFARIWDPIEKKIVSRGKFKRYSDDGWSYFSSNYSEIY